MDIDKMLNEISKIIARQPLPSEYHEQKYAGVDYKRQIMSRFCKVE